VIYLDAAYVAKCYVNEPGADRVREVAYGVTASHLVNWRDWSSHRSSSGTSERDVRASGEDPQAVLDLPSTVFLRSVDALHLACTEEHWLPGGLHERPPHAAGREALPRDRGERPQ
jgi:hypothetical protein